MRQSERALNKLGALTFERYDQPNTIRSGFQTFVEVDSESWKSTKGESITFHSNLEAFYLELVKRLASQNRSEIWTLKINEEPAASFICLRYRNVLYTLKTSYKQKYASARHSPGKVLLSQMIKEAWRAKLVGVDFVGKVPFVEHWASEDRGYDQLIIFRKRYYGYGIGILNSISKRTAMMKRFLHARSSRLNKNAGSVQVA